MTNGYASSREATEDNMVMRDGPDVYDSLCRLLTPHLARKIKELNIYDSSGIGRNGSAEDPTVLHDFPADTPRGQYLRSLAKLLTVNSVTPYLIWDNRCRVELVSLLDAQVELIMRTVRVFQFLQC